jgi:cytochrome c oxidase cbb3-type subunit 2
MSEHNEGFFHKVELSSILTVLGIILLFSGAVIVTLIAPRHLDSSWIQPSSPYQVQMYEVADPNIYISSIQSGSNELQSVYHLKKGYSLLAFHESEGVRIVAPKSLEKFITRFGEPTLKLTSRMLMLRSPKVASEGADYDAAKEAEKIREELQGSWAQEHPDWQKKGLQKPAYEILELFELNEDDGFALAATDRIIENWVDNDYKIIDEKVMQSWHRDSGVIYVNNPTEYRVKYYKFGSQEGWSYDPSGKPLKGVEELISHPLGFRSRKDLISLGEHIYAIEGCWYCHTDQTRTLIQDVVLNGSEAYPAPPSSANEYIYQKITFPGTRRIGPDISRTGVKRPSRDWHQSHFWSPKTASKGSIMPSFQHFFDYDPRGTGRRESGIPNYRFEAIFQYLMTKGTRITPPTEAWWLGKDPIKTKEIIEGERKL